MIAYDKGDRWPDRPRIYETREDYNDPREAQGVCVGGPYDGKLWSAPGKVFVCVEAEPLPAIHDIAAGMAYAEKPLKYHRYQIEEVRLPSNESLWFWLHETLTYTDGVKKVFTAYGLSTH